MDKHAIMAISLALVSIRKSKKRQKAKTVAEEIDFGKEIELQREALGSRSARILQSLNRLIDGSIQRNTQLVSLNKEFIEVDVSELQPFILKVQEDIQEAWSPLGPSVFTNMKNEPGRNAEEKRARALRLQFVITHLLQNSFRLLQSASVSQSKQSTLENLQQRITHLIEAVFNGIIAASNMRRDSSSRNGSNSDNEDIDDGTGCRSGTLLVLPDQERSNLLYALTDAYLANFCLPSILSSYPHLLEQAESLVLGKLVTIYDRLSAAACAAPSSVQHDLAIAHDLAIVRNLAYRIESRARNTAGATKGH